MRRGLVALAVAVGMWGCGGPDETEELKTYVKAIQPFVTYNQQVENTIRQHLGIPDPGLMGDLLRTPLVGDALAGVDGATAFAAVMSHAAANGHFGVNLSANDIIQDTTGESLPNKRDRERLIQQGDGTWVRPDNLGLGEDGDLIAEALAFIAGPFLTVHDNTETGNRTTTFAMPRLPFDIPNGPMGMIEFEITQGDEVSKEIQQELNRVVLP